MTYDYFYGQQAEMFAFYRVPKVLFTEDCFWNVSTDAKLLYGILLDRMNGMIHRVKSDRSDIDMVYEIMLKLGVPLTYSVRLCRKESGKAAG